MVRPGEPLGRGLSRGGGEVSLRSDENSDVRRKNFGRWVTVDLVEGSVDKPMEVEAHCSR